jgi:hypothetical protein
MFCFGLSAFNQCSESQLTEHFLFNFETAISSLAIVVSVYALLLEKRFRVRVVIKRNQLKLLLIFAGSILLFTFIGSILPYLLGEALPMLGYPVFWEILASVVLFFSIIIAYKLIRPIKKLTKKQIKALYLYAPHSTIKYNGEIELMVKEAENFWPDFLEKSINNEKIKEVLNNYFSEKDFLRFVAKSYYILINTVDFVSNPKYIGQVRYAEHFLRELIMTSLSEDESILNDDLSSSYKELMQYIVREKKLANKIFGESFSTFELHLTNESALKIILRVLSVFELYIGRKYHYADNTKDYFNIIDSVTLKNFFVFFEENIYILGSDNLKTFLNKLSYIFVDLKELSEEHSTVLAEGIYQILENSAGILNSSQNQWSIRQMLLTLNRTLILANETTKKVFEKRLLEKIVGTDDKNSEAYFSSNLDCYYPMMIPIYFHLYGYELFADKGQKIPTENMKMHLIILKKMKERLPIISSGRMQEYLKIGLPKDSRGKEVIKKRAEECLLKMFPDNMFYDKELNTITYIFGNEEMSETILLDKTYLKNKIVYKK